LAGLESSKGTVKQTLKELLPYGLLATKKWLAAQGLSDHALDNAVKSETLLSLANGVYSQYTRNIRWEGVVASLQQMSVKNNDPVPPMHVGGLTAMELSGLSQYLSLSTRKIVHLYSCEKLPSWLPRLSLSNKFEGHSVKTLWPEALMSSVAYVKENKWEVELPPVIFSCPEKAIMEVLLGVPDAVSFEHADELMQGLVNLSPRKLDELLSVCRSIKVKRLFFWFAQRQGYPWFIKLDQGKYDLGSGKRVVAKGGKLDNDYLITVPRHMVNGSS